MSVVGDGVRVFGRRAEGVTYRERDAVYAVIRDERGNLALVLPPRFARFFLVGGAMEAGETAEEAIAREAREEIGATLADVRQIGEARQYFDGEGGEGWDMRARFFEARIDRHDESAGEYDLLWVPPPVAIPQMFHECHAWAISQTVRERQ